MPILDIVNASTNAHDVVVTHLEEVLVVRSLSKQSITFIVKCSIELSQNVPIAVFVDGKIIGDPIPLNNIDRKDITCKCINENVSVINIKNNEDRVSTRIELTFLLKHNAIKYEGGGIVKFFWSTYKEDTLFARLDREYLRTEADYKLKKQSIPVVVRGIEQILCVVNRKPILQSIDEKLFDKTGRFTETHAYYDVLADHGLFSKALAKWYIIKRAQIAVYNLVDVKEIYDIEQTDDCLFLATVPRCVILKFQKRKLDFIAVVSLIVSLFSFVLSFYSLSDEKLLNFKKGVLAWIMRFL